MISQITETLFIGSAEAANSPANLRNFGITDVLFLHNPSPQWPSDDIVLHHHPIPDGKNLDEETLIGFADYIAKLEQHGHVLVACAAGISRSSTVVLAYLLSQGMALEDAYKYLLAQHPIADPHPKLWESLLDAFKLEASWLDIMQWRIEGKQ